MGSWSRFGEYFAINIFCSIKCTNLMCCHGYIAYMYVIYTFLWVCGCACVSMTRLTWLGPPPHHAAALSLSSLAGHSKQDLWQACANWRIGSGFLLFFFCFWGQAMRSSGGLGGAGPDRRTIKWNQRYETREMTTLLNGLIWEASGLEKRRKRSDRAKFFDCLPSSSTWRIFRLKIWLMFLLFWLTAINKDGDIQIQLSQGSRVLGSVCCAYMAGHDVAAEIYLWGSY